MLKQRTGLFGPRFVSECARFLNSSIKIPEKLDLLCEKWVEWYFMPGKWPSKFSFFWILIKKNSVLKMSLIVASRLNTNTPVTNGRHMLTAVYWVWGSGGDSCSSSAQTRIYHLFLLCILDSKRHATTWIQLHSFASGMLSTITKLGVHISAKKESRNQQSISLHLCKDLICIF